jgi:hypothetical protein
MLLVHFAIFVFNLCKNLIILSKVESWHQNKEKGDEEREHKSHEPCFGKKEEAFLLGIVISVRHPTYVKEDWDTTLQESLDKPSCLLNKFLIVFIIFHCFFSIDVSSIHSVYNTVSKYDKMHGGESHPVDIILSDNFLFRQYI